MVKYIFNLKYIISIKRGVRVNMYILKWLWTATANIK